MPPRLDGETSVVPIVGDPVAQVKSPEGVTEALCRRGANIVVVPALVAPAELGAFFAGLRATRNCPALIVTVPHKTAALSFCDQVSDRARLAGSVNIALRTGQGWIGDNTDGAAFLEGLATMGQRPDGRRALVIGAGGAGSAIAAEILWGGSAHLAIHDIDIARRDGLVARLAEAHPGRVSVGSRDPRGYDIVVNASPLGMRPDDDMPADTEALSPGQVAGCVITRPEVSPFIASARARGCRTMTGSQMFAAGVDLIVEAILSVGVSS